MYAMLETRTVVLLTLASLFDCNDEYYQQQGHNSPWLPWMIREQILLILFIVASHN
jgi:hypothetical protein